MSNLRCIVVEDEPLAVKVLTDYIAQVPFLELQAAFRDAILATDFLRRESTDLIFLDIHLPKMKGLSFLKTLTPMPAVIITTAYHQYAVDGFNLNVTDYLLKPIEFERFLVAVGKVRGDRRPADPRDFVFISVQKKKVKVLFEDILYVESQREYVKITTTKGDYISKVSTHEIESMLPAHLFRRVHRSFIVSIRRIESYTAEMVEVGGVSIPIGKGYKEGLDHL